MVIFKNIKPNLQIERFRILLDGSNGKGSYALVLKLPQAKEIEVGRLGTFNFPKGTFLYCGSAFGSGGLAARINHHFKKLRNFSNEYQWHIDYFIRFTNLVRIYYSHSATNLECIWSQMLANLPAAFIPVRGFGATDCKNRCLAHLIGFPSRYRSDKWLQALQKGEELISDKYSRMEFLH